LGGTCWVVSGGTMESAAGFSESLVIGFLMPLAGAFLVLSLGSFLGMGTLNAAIGSLAAWFTLRICSIRRTYFFPGSKALSGRSTNRSINTGRSASSFLSATAWVESTGCAGRPMAGFGGGRGLLAALSSRALRLSGRAASESRALAESAAARSAALKGDGAAPRGDPGAVGVIPRSRRRRAKRKGKDVLLADLPLNVEARVIRVETSDPGRLHRLASLGILPGASLRLVQHRGAYLAVLDRYQIAFDRRVAEAVWVTTARE